MIRRLHKCNLFLPAKCVVICRHPRRSCRIVDQSRLRNDSRAGYAGGKENRIEAVQIFGIIRQPSRQAPNASAADVTHPDDKHRKLRNARFQCRHRSCLKAAHAPAEKQDIFAVPFLHRFQKAERLHIPQNHIAEITARRIAVILRFKAVMLQRAVLQVGIIAFLPPVLHAVRIDRKGHAPVRALRRRGKRMRCSRKRTF